MNNASAPILRKLSEIKPGMVIANYGQVRTIAFQTIIHPDNEQTKMDFKVHFYNTSETMECLSDSEIWAF